MATYKIVNDAMVEEVENPSTDERRKHLVECWMAEFSVSNFNRCRRMMDELNKIQLNPSDEDFWIPATSRSIIKDIGTTINREGGMDAMRACFYIMRCFMDNDGRASYIENIWDGIGSWQM
jgi:hypothetical protein